MHTYVATYMRTYIHTYIHTLMQTSPCFVMDARHCGSINIVLEREQIHVTYVC